MRIIFVRHGHPDYAHDCLTELGHRHAAAAAERLRDEGVERIFSSTCGRALETAGYLAEKAGLSIERCDFMREINWGFADGAVYAEDASPWNVADRMIASGIPLMDADWAQKEPFCRNRVVRCVQEVAEGTDAWLRTLGYAREGQYYRVTGEAPETIAAFGHGGASSAILSHLLNLPFPFVCAAMGPDYTGVTIVTLAGDRGALVSPRLTLLNDARHIRDLRIENIYGR